MTVATEGTGVGVGCDWVGVDEAIIDVVGGGEALGAGVSREQPAKTTAATKIRNTQCFLIGKIIPIYAKHHNQQLVMFPPHLHLEQERICI